MPKQGTKPEDQDLVRLYLTDIGQYALLTKEDEVRLAKEIEAGRDARRALDGPQALEAKERRRLQRVAAAGARAETDFVQSNLRLVVSIAKKYQASGLPLLDLVQEGNFGLIRAVEKFDWRKGFKFSTYATWWIRQAITRGIANTARAIRLPVHAADAQQALIRARGHLEGVLGRAPTPRELAIELGESVEKVMDTMAFVTEPVSLHEPLRSDSDTELSDVVHDPNAPSAYEEMFLAWLPDEVARMLSPLGEDERRILALRFGLDRGEPRTLEDVGAHPEVNLSRERVRQVEARAMSKLRHPSGDGGAHDLLSA